MDGLARGDMQEVMVEDIRDCMTICPIKIQISARLLILGLNNRGSATLLRRYSLSLQQCDTTVILLPKAPEMHCMADFVSRQAPR